MSDDRRRSLRAEAPHRTGFLDQRGRRRYGKNNVGRAVGPEMKGLARQRDPKSIQHRVECTDLVGARKQTIEFESSERSGQAHLHRGSMGSGAMAYDSLRNAMAWYEKAEAIRPAGNDDSILRWNTCARLIDSHAQVAPHTENAYEPALED